MQTATPYSREYLVAYAKGHSFELAFDAGMKAQPDTDAMFMPGLGERRAPSPGALDGSCRRHSPD